MMIGGGGTMATALHGGTLTPDLGLSMITANGPGGMLTQRIGSIGTKLTCGGLGVALMLHPGKGNGLSLTFTRCGLGGTHSPRLGTGGMQAHGHGDGANLTHG